MGYSDDELQRIYNKTGGYCYHCGARLAWGNCGLGSASGAWEVSLSRKRSQDLTKQLNELVPSCMPCNRSDVPEPVCGLRRRRGLVRRLFQSVDAPTL